MKVKNLGQLLSVFEERMAKDKNRISMTRTAVRCAVRAFGARSASEIPASAFDRLPDVLAGYLKAEGSSKPKLRNYTSFVRRLIHWGEETGIVTLCDSYELSKNWRQTIDKCGQRLGRRWSFGWNSLGSWASSKDLEPNDLTSSDLVEFAQWLRTSGWHKDWRRAYCSIRRMWKRASTAGMLPALDVPALPRKMPSYHLPFREWPPQLQEEYKGYRDWATGQFVPGRPRTCKQREVTAKKTLSMFERIAGYFVKVKGIRKNDLNFDIFYDRDLVTDLLKWLSSERGLRGTSLFTIVVTLASIGLQYRKLSKESLVWLLELKEQLRDSQPRDKSYKMVSLKDLRTVPERLRRERLALERDLKRGKEYSIRRWARMVRDEVAIRLLISRPLRSRNIREARLGRNLFKTRDGRWRMLFEGEETKVGNKLGFFLPRSLGPCLELYLEKARPILVEGKSSDFLLVSHTARPLNTTSLRELVKKHCMKYLGKPVTPHVIRDIVAYGILSENPGDYLKVKELLGHRSINTTLRIYGHYGMDDAAKSYDEMLGLDSDGSEDPSRDKDDTDR